MTSDGLTVVFTDVYFNPSQFEVISIDSGATFTLFSEPHLEADAGVLRRVGGATLEPHHGANRWTQVSVIELRALVDVARPTATLRPSQGEAVSRRGRGLVPTDRIRVIPDRGHKPKSIRSGVRNSATGKAANE